MTTAADGWRLSVRELAARGPVRGAALLLPAMMVDRRTMDRPGTGLGSTLAAAGFHVFLGDFRGHGASGPSASEGGRWSYDDLVRQDIPALTALVRRSAPGLPLWVVGHSLGGHVSIAAAALGACAVPVDGHVLLATNIWLPRFEPSVLRRVQKHLSMLSFRATTRAVGRFPSSRLRAGPVDESEPYVMDLTRFWFDDAWRGRDGLDYLAAMTRVRGPLLAVVGAADSLLGHAVSARGWAGAFGPGRVDFRVVGRASGLEFDPDHMGLVVDPRARPLWSDLAQWMAQKLPVA